MHSIIFSTMGETWLDFGALTIACTREFWICWEPGNLRLGEVVIELQAWSEQWKWRWWRLFWNQGMDGYSEADGCGNSRIWRQMRSGHRRWGVQCSSNMKPMFRAMVLSEALWILASCLLRQMSRNSVLDVYKLPSIKDRGQTKNITILADLTLTHDFQFSASSGHDPYTCKNQVQRSLDSKARTKTNRRTNRQEQLQNLAR